MARTSPVPGWVPSDLPQSPGVYHFVDALGTPIYIGKSVNVRRRVRGYFYGGGPGDERLRDMLRLARGVDVKRAGSDLEARLEEADGIATYRPGFNRVGKNRSRGWYIEADWSAPFPRLRVVTQPRSARAQYLGPFRGRRIPEEATQLVEKIYRLRSCPGSIRPDPDGSPCLQYGIDQCVAPCVGLIHVDHYRALVRRAIDALVDGAAAAREAGQIRGLLSRSDLPPETLVSLRRRLTWFEELDTYRPGLRGPDVDRSRLIVLPGADPGSRVLVPVARGRVLARNRIEAGRSGWRREVEDTCYRVRVEELRAESAFPVSALTLTLIVSAWLRDGGPTGHSYDLDRMTTREVVDSMEGSMATGDAALVRRPRQTPRTPPVVPGGRATPRASSAAAM